MKKSIYFLSIVAIILSVSFTAIAQKQAKPELTATIAGLNKGEITKDFILNDGIIQCSDQKYEVIYFNLSALLKNGDIIVYYGKENALTESMKQVIKNMEPGSKLVIEDIGARSEDEKVIKLPDIVLTLK